MFTSWVSRLGATVTDENGITHTDLIGTDAAIEAADVALMKDDFSDIPAIISLGHLVTKISRQDFLIWGLLNVCGLTLAILGIIGPEGAAAFNFVTDFIPIFNSLRLFRHKFAPSYK